MNIEEEQTPDLDSVGGKIWNVVENHFPAGKFTSSTCLKSMRMNTTSLSN